MKTTFIIVWIATVITLYMAWSNPSYAYEWFMSFGILCFVLYIIWDILIRQR